MYDDHKSGNRLQMSLSLNHNYQTCRSRWWRGSPWGWLSSLPSRSSGRSRSARSPWGAAPGSAAGPAPRPRRSGYQLNTTTASNTSCMSGCWQYLHTSPLRQSVCSCLHSAALFLHMKKDQVHWTASTSRQSWSSVKVAKSMRSYQQTLELTLRDLAAALGQAGRVGVTSLVHGAGRHSRVQAGGGGGGGGGGEHRGGDLRVRGGVTGGGGTHAELLPAGVQGLGAVVEEQDAGGEPWQRTASQLNNLDISSHCECTHPCPRPPACGCRGPGPRRAPASPPCPPPACRSRRWRWRGTRPPRRRSQPPSSSGSPTCSQLNTRG